MIHAGSLQSLALSLAVLAFAAGTARAGEFNQMLTVGDAAPAWTDLPNTDGTKHSLSQLKDKPVVVIVFTCLSCPIARDYEERILAFNKKYCGPEGKVALVAINVNKVKQDSPELMAAWAKEHGQPFPFLFDGTQKIARDYGAIFTPEFYVLDADRKLAYMGGMDDSSDVSAVKTQYLEPAIEAVLAGKKPATGETLARGCRIRYERKRE